MEALLVVLLVVGALAIGACVGWFVRSGRAIRELSSAHTRVAGAEALAMGLREQLTLARAATSERDERDRRDQSVLQALGPVHETLRTMQRQVADLERERSEQFGAIATQLRLSHESDEQLRRTTDSLASALRSNATRGVWGEAALKRVVEAAGLTKHVDFATQASVTSDAGTGRPDMVIHLAGGKSIPVDAKVPLDAYLEASAIPAAASGADQERRDDLLQRHVKAVRAHIDALAKKAYWAGFNASPEFVICFIPNESLLASALDADPTLLDYAFGKRVALASPVNLWAVLKTVAYTWTQQEVSDEARRLFDLGTQLYDRLGSLSGHAAALRKAIERTVAAYNGFVGSLESRVLVTARSFPGVDETKLLVDPGVVTASTRPLTAPELTSGSLDDAGPDSSSDPAASGSGLVGAADLGDIRGRL